jgi:hypothetical protein
MLPEPLHSRFSKGQAPLPLLSSELQWRRFKEEVGYQTCETSEFKTGCSAMFRWSRGYLDHPLRAVRRLTEAVLGTLSPEVGSTQPQGGRRPRRSILRALLLQVFYSVRSVRLLVEQIDCNLLFRWFVGLDMDDAV